MRDLKVGIIQFSPLYKKTEKNLTKILQLIQEGGSSGAKIICLPEMCLSGYIFVNPEDARPWALDPEFSPEIAALQSAAADFQIYLAFGFLEHSGKGLYNSQLLIGPKGEKLGLYRKRHLFEPDYWWAQPGDGHFLSIPTPIGNLGLGICMDLNYRDFVDYHIRQKTDMVLFSTNWVDQGFLVQDYWNYRWSGFSGVVLTANRGGEEFGLGFSGYSSITQKGEVLGQLTHGENALLVVNLQRPAAPGLN
jgi:predicted amidohydrolase